jgi:hypothetical protein
MVAEQREGGKEALTQANKLSRTHAALLEALNRHRGKGQQKVTVEHVHEGGQPLLATWWGVRYGPNRRINPCTWICTGPNGAERQRGAGSLASLRRWQTVVRVPPTNFFVRRLQLSN